MRPHNRVDRRQFVDIDSLARFLDPRSPRRGDLCLVGGADDPQIRKRRLQPVRKLVIGKFLIGEQCIAPDRRQFDGLQHRRHWRLVLIAGVGVPDATEIDRLVLALQHRGDLGDILDTFQKRIDGRFAKGARKFELLLRCQVLVAKHNHIMLQPDSPDLADDIVRKIARCEIDAGDFSTHRRRQLCNLHVGILIYQNIGAKDRGQRPVTGGFI